MRVAQRLLDAHMPVALVLLFGVALTLPGCLPGERSNDPLPDVKVDTVAADAAKTDTKGDGAAADGSLDAAEEVTGTEQDVPVLGDVAALGCKVNGDCVALPTLPCHATPTCNAETGLCDSPQLDEAAPCNSDACLVGQTCDASGACGGGTAKNCSDNNGCTLDLCGNGVCSHPFANASCSDGVQCTVSDHCDPATLKCVGTQLDCSDGEPCTTDACNEKGDISLGVLSLCTHQGFPYTAKSVPCTGNDPADTPICNNGSCGVPKNCDDKNPCTTDGPNGLTGACDNTYVGDGVGCGTDKCNPGTCQMVAGTDAVALPTCVTKSKCDDNKSCTTDKCDANTGTCDSKTTLKLGTPCTTTDPCVVNGQCDGKTTCKSTTVVTCNDGNPCTDDSCISGVGCVGTANTKTCTDGNGCTSSDACAGGLCSGKPVNCDDANACTIDACDPVAGCTHTLATDGTDCGNSSACSQGICKAK